MNYFHPETLKRISRLSLRARHVVDGFLSGQHQSRHFGNSIEFRQHRQYVPGDDPRSVDWKVWAKQDRLYVKQYEMDTNLRLALLVDVSQSMAFGSTAMTKFEYACTLAASLGYLAIRQQDAVGCLLFDRDMKIQLPAKTKQSYLHTITHLMEKEEAILRNRVHQQNNLQRGDLQSLLQDFQKAEVHLQEALRRAAESLPARGLVVIVSDFLTNRDGLFSGLRYLRGRGHDVLVLHVLDDMELDFTLRGATRFDGLELPLQIRCDPRVLRQGYLHALHAYLEEMKVGCTKNQCDYQLFRTSRPLDAALATYLSKRNALMKRR